MTASEIRKLCKMSPVTIQNFAQILEVGEVDGPACFLKRQSAVQLAALTQ